MSEIIIIAAIANNGVIGKDGKMPWHYKEDLKHFKELTLNSPIIMGKTTYEGLPIKPLPKRENIVLTKNKNYEQKGITIINSLDEALDYCKGKEKTFIIGGASVYEQSMKYANKLELTKINKNYPGDTFFPRINYDEWNLEKEIIYPDFSFETYIRKS